MSHKTYTAAAFAVAAQLSLSPIPEVSTIKVVAAYFVSNCALLFYLLIFTHQRYSVVALVIDFFSINVTFILTAVTITIIRRLYFSPLSKFPGPKIAAVSRLWEANEFRTGRASVTRKNLFVQYDSDIVRVGPNEVCVNNVDAIAKIYKGKYHRGTFYEMGAINGEFNLNSTRDYENHTRWRRIWERAFVSSEFKDYNPRVERHVSKLVGILKTQQNTEINFTKLMENLAFDIMADLMFSHNARMQDGTGDASYIEFIHKYTSIVAIVGSLRNVCQLLPYLPVSAEVAKFRLNCESLLATRQKLSTSPRDLFQHLLAKDTETGSRLTQAQLDSNAHLAIVAGSDTTSNSLTQAFRVLATDHRILRKLQAELDSACDDGSTQLTVATTKNLPYLNAVVNEVVRLYNAVPCGIQATTPPGGLEVLPGVHLPGSCQVQVPHAAVMTDERYFPCGDAFIPERWTGERPELVRDRRAYVPFGYGVHSCVGKQLALNEMRLTIACVVSAFDVVLGDGYEEGAFWAEWRDYMVAKAGALELRVVARR